MWSESAGFDNGWQRGIDGEFMLAERPLSEVVAEVGSTPCYLYDRARISQRCRDLRSRLDPSVHLHYAVKANPMPALVNHVARRVEGLDVASSGELRVALDAGVDPAQTSFAGPGKSDHELAQAHAAGVLINIESFREIRLLSELANYRDRAPRVAVRVNLPFELRASGMKMTGGSRQFGIDADEVPHALDLIARSGLEFHGFHLFAGSQNLRADAIIEAQNRSYECAMGWIARTPLPLRSLNLGGGFGIPYSLADQRLDVGQVIDNLNALSARLRRDCHEAHLVIELGRYLVGEAGIYVCRVVDRKISKGKVFLVTDGGMHHHLAASGNFGQVVRRNYPLAVNRVRGDPEVATVVGPLCTPLDLIGDNVKMHPAREGDLIIVFQSGAYGRSASPRGFLGHPDVVEALV